MPYTTYAIGDVHGRADLLAPLLEALAQDAEASGVDPRVLFLGDIVDRGPSSRQAMDLVCETLERWPRSRLIRGNHDAYFLDFMTRDARTSGENLFVVLLVMAPSYLKVGTSCLWNPLSRVVRAASNDATGVQ